MKLLSTLLFLLVQLASLPSIATALEGVILGELEMQMRSQSPTKPAELLVQVIVQTSQFLDAAFSSVYEGTDHGFFYTSITASSYKITTAPNDGFAAIITLAGTAFFEQAPPQQQVSTITAAAFEQDNQEFLQRLLDSTDPFLQDIDYAIVTVNGIELSGSGGNTRNDDNSTNDTDDDGMEAWALALIVGASTFAFVSLLCFLCLCCAPAVSEQVLHSSSGISGKGYSTSKESEDEEDGGGGGVPRAVRTARSISPSRSITSQASSCFTYNPKSSKSASAHGSFLTADDDVTKQGDTIGSTMNDNDVPFGHDISVIESKKDLSLIVEGDYEDATPNGKLLAKNNNTGSSKSKSLTVQPTYATAPNRGGTKRRSRSNSRTRRSLQLTAQSASAASDVNGAAHDVIADLNDLSYQIDRCRSGTNNNNKV